DPGAGRQLRAARLARADGPRELRVPDRALPGRGGQGGAGRHAHAAELRGRLCRWLSCTIWRAGEPLRHAAARVLSRGACTGGQADAGRRHPPDGRRTAAIAGQSLAGLKPSTEKMNKVWLKNYPHCVPAEINPNEYSSLTTLIESSCQRFAQQDAFSSLGRLLSYAEFDSAA